MRTVSSSFHSLVASPKVEPSTPFPSVHPPTHPPLDFPPLVSPVRHTNPFSHSQSTPPPISPRNPFFSLLQQNPFYDDMLSAQPLKPSLPPLPFVSSSRPPVSHLFPQTDDPNATPIDVCRSSYSDARMVRAEKRPLPPTPAEMSSRRSPNPFTPAGQLEPDSQWDDSFEAFAAGRLQPPEDLTTESQSQRCTSDSLSKRGGHGGALLPSSRHAPHEFGSETRSSTSRSSNANLTRVDGFPLFLETIPEHNDSVAFEPDAPLKDSANAESNQANNNTNVHFLTNTNADPGSYHPSAGKLISSSPDPASSGIGSSVEEDFLSCLSSYSDKFSASSAEESEAQNLDADAIAFEKSCECNGKSKASESDDDRSNDPSLFGAERNAVIRHGNGEVLEGSPVGTQHQPVAAAADLQPKEDNKREEFQIPLEASPPTEVMIRSPPDVLQPPCHIITSSPDVKGDSADLPTEGASWGLRGPPIPFEDFPISPGSSFNGRLLPALPSDQSNSSFLQSLYVSSDSQNYQTCGSHSPSKRSSGSEPNQTLHSANSTLFGELADVVLTAGAALEAFPDTSKPSLEDTFSKWPHAQTLQRSHSEGSLQLASDEHPGASSAALPPLTSSAPLTPDHASSPVALCSLPPFANATARSPAGTPRAAASKPVSVESRQQQAANQQNR